MYLRTLLFYGDAQTSDDGRKTDVANHITYLLKNFYFSINIWFKKVLNLFTFIIRGREFKHAGVLVHKIRRIT